MAPLEGTGLATFNALPDEAARTALLACCSSPAWADRLTARRPYDSVTSLLSEADAALADLDEREIDEALAGHPRIGDRTATTHNGWSRREQSGVDHTSDATLAALAAGNEAYETRFGHVYLVCATGRSAEELLAILQSRLHNDPDTERKVVRDELGKINRIRLERLLGA